MRGTVGLASVLVAACSYAACAEPSKCAAITDNQQRLACYDALASEKPAAREATIEASPQNRASYGRQLRKSFLAAGLDILLIVDEKRNPKLGSSKPKHYPRLYLMGPFSNPLVYQIAADKDFLRTTKELGFLGVEFSATTGPGRWFFDLTGASLPRCDDIGAVCL